MNRPSYKELWLDEVKSNAEELELVRDAVDGNAEVYTDEPYSEGEYLARKIMQMHAHIAELEERLESCESALTSMVYQFFYPSESGALVHSFMSAEEEAAEYLVDYSIARWENERKNSIVFEGVQE